MEEEAEKLKEMQGEVEKQMMSTKTSTFLLVHTVGIKSTLCSRFLYR